MSINQISTSNTFQQWLIATQQLINSHNYYEEDFVTISDLANIMYELANTTSNVYVSTVDVYNTIVLYVNTAYDIANSAYDVANSAYDVANATLNIANLALNTVNSISYDPFNVSVQSSSSSAHYPLLSNTESGIVSKMYTSGLVFYPANNTLAIANVNIVNTLTYNGYDVLTIEDVGTIIQEYDEYTARYDDSIANFTGTLQSKGNSVITISELSGYAKYDDSIANFTGGLQVGGSDVISESNVDNDPVFGLSTHPISSGWAFNHSNNNTAHNISTFGATLVSSSSNTNARSVLGLGSAATMTGPTGTIVGTTDTQVIGGKTFDNYYETGGTLPIVGGTLTIPLNGKIYNAATLSVTTTLATNSAPTTPNCGSAVIFLTQNSSAKTVVVPSGWYWRNNVAETFASASAYYRLTLITDPVGNIHADAEVRAT